MALTAATSGTYTPAAVGTNYSVYTETPASPFFYAWMVDTTNMVNGDQLVLTILVAVLGGGTRQIVRRPVYGNAQAEPIKLSIPIPCDASIEFQLQQAAGAAARPFPHKIWRW